MLLVWLVGGLFGFLVCRFINQSVGQLLSRLFQGLIVRWVGCLWVSQSVLWTVCQSVVRSVDCLVGWQVVG